MHVRRDVKYGVFQIHPTGQMMGAKLAAFLVSFILSGTAAASGVRFAIVQLDGAGHGVLITDAPLVKGSVVDIQYPAAKHGAACCKRLSSADFSAASVEGLLVTDEVGGAQPLVYRVRVPKLWSEAPFIGVAAVGTRMRTRSAGTQLESRDQGGRPRRAGICTSQEGVHLQEKVGSTERTHLYMSLGYEVEKLTCR